MSITTEPAPLSYNGNDSTVDFSITWKYFAKSDVSATLRNAAGAETTWVLNTNYTLTDANVDTGGTLTATTAPATGQTLVISLDPPNTQDSSLPVGGSFPSSTVEDELDQSAQRDGKLETLFNRALRVPKTDLRTDTDLELPIDTERASKYLKFDANGVPVAADGTATLGETGLLGQDTESELTIATGSVTPTVSTHSIDTEADAATDNLDTIVTTNLENGRLLLIRGENAARVVTVRNAQGGAGQINTRDNNNVVLGDEKYMLLQRRGTDWYEVQTGGITVMADDTSPQLGGALDTNAFSINESEGTAVASAATTNIWATNGNTIHVTGSTGPITSFGTAPRVGAWRKVIFDGTPTLTHAANLNLPGSANIIAAADDFAYIYADTTTQFDVLYFRKDGIQLTVASEAQGDIIYRGASAWARLGAGTASQVLRTGGAAANPSWGSPITLATEQATTSGTAYDFTGIPAGTKIIRVIFEEVSFATTASDWLIQLGDAGGIENTNYVSTVAAIDATPTVATNTSGFVIGESPGIAGTFSGTVTLTLKDSTGFTWTSSGIISGGGQVHVSSGVKSLSAELTQLRFTTVGGQTGDNGSINIQYE